MKNLIYKSRFTYSFILFIAVVGLVGIPFKKWGFKTDDFGNIYHCKMQSISDIPKFFYEGNIEHFNHASNHPELPQAFFCGLYRPMSFLYYYAQYLFFGNSPYCYFLLTIMIHAANAALLFYLFSLWLSLLLAFCGATFFAFHPSLWNWLGWISAQTYHIELLVMLLSLIVLKKFLDDKKFGYYLLSLLLYAANLFLKEQTIVFPVWIIGALYFYTKQAQGGKNSLKNSIAWSAGYWLVALFYICCRAIVFPLTSNTSTLTFEPTWASFITRQQARLFDFVTYITDLYGLSWIPGGNQFLKSTIILSIGFLICWLFTRSNKKLLMVFCGWSTLVFSWPALLMHHQPRYLYLALPFIILMVLVGIASHQPKTFSYLAARSCTACFVFLIMLHTNFLLTRLKQREEVLFHVTHAFEKLAHHDAIRHKPVCFFNLPPQWFAMGNAQAVWLLTGNDHHHVYDFGTHINLKDRATYLQAPIFDHNPISITKTQEGFDILSQDTNTVWFNHDNKKSGHATITIPQSYQEQKPVYVTWDYQKGEFKIL